MLFWKLASISSIGIIPISELRLNYYFQRLNVNIQCCYYLLIKTVWNFHELTILLLISNDPRHFLWMIFIVFQKSPYSRRNVKNSSDGGSRLFGIYHHFASYLNLLFFRTNRWPKDFFFYISGSCRFRYKFDEDRTIRKTIVNNPIGLVKVTRYCVNKNVLKKFLPDRLWGCQ